MHRLIDIDRRLFIALIIGVFMGAMDLTIVAPALPHIAESFGVTPSAVILAFSIYAAFYAVSVLLMSKLSDVRGYRPVYTASMALFAAGSALAALAPSLPVLVVARVIQGIGGGGLFPIAQAIVGATLPEREQSKMLSILMGAFAVGGVLGPNLGGLLAQHLSWHWIFWINVPLGVVAVGLLMGTRLTERRRHAPVDWAGLVLISLAFGGLVLAIEGLRDLQATLGMRTVVLFVVSLVAFGMLIPIERRAAEPILDVRLVRSRSIAPLLAVSFLTGYALLGGVVFTPLYMQLVFGASALGSGAVLNAAAVGLGISSWIAGAYTNRFGGKVLVTVGMALSAAGLTLMVVLHHSLWSILGGLVFLGAGSGLSQGPLSFLGLSLASDEAQGQISGLISITRSMGGAIGMTLAGVWLGQASSSLSQVTAGNLGTSLSAQTWGSSGSLQVLQDAPAAAQLLVRQTLGAGLIHGWYWALAAALLGVAVSFLIKKAAAPTGAAPEHLGSTRSMRADRAQPSRSGTLEGSSRKEMDSRH